MTKKSPNYFEAVGRRKESVARIRLSGATKQDIVINDRDLKNYFPVTEWQNQILKVLARGGGKFHVSAKVSGGGVHSQAEAVVQGVARALIVYDATLRVPLKKEGWLRRDPRAKERRKFGLKKARKAPQWSKR